ncbi:hypothetical protein WIS52_09940 [Pseudonocardia nematodicida]|uniref:Uncharacterized protein n=1 Tax=Pseudonocardia nematodicida TaxID=1206997 RepID=A0ABV1KB11_9PSEU
MPTELTPTADPRRSLATQAAGIDRTKAIADAQYLDFTMLPATSTDAGDAWTTRGQNAVVHHVAARRPGTVVDTVFESETVLILTDAGAAVDVTWEGTTGALAGHGVAVLPPGAVRIDNTGTADLTLLVRSDEPGWAERASNAAAFAEPSPRVAPAEPWPAPPGPEQVRFYKADEHPLEQGRFGRIFRSRSFMVNLLAAHDGPRPADKLSPHHHDDFEQYSLATHGHYTHHIRTPWVTDRNHWKADEHVGVGSPSLTVIPPPTVHTSEADGPGENRLIDIFCPPRADFSAKPGWVRNAEDFPA